MASVLLKLLCAMPNAIYIEMGSLNGDPSTVEKLRMADGAMLAPESPGMGSELLPEHVQKHKVG